MVQINQPELNAIAEAIEGLSAVQRQMQNTGDLMFGEVQVYNVDGDFLGSFIINDGELVFQPA